MGRGGGLKEAIPRQVVKRRLKLETGWGGVLLGKDGATALKGSASQLQTQKQRKVENGGSRAMGGRVGGVGGW